MAGIAIGIDVGGTNTKGALVSSDGSVVERFEQPTDPSSGTKGIIRVAEHLVARGNELGSPAEAIGIGAAGLIDRSNGSVIQSPNLAYDDPKIADAVRSHLDLPVLVDNDANAAAWGERLFGAARGLDHLALITIGTGIGSGFVVDGRLLRGAHGAAAEFGHTVIDPSGPECPCGLRGCLEQFASGTAIARMARNEIAKGEASMLVKMAGAAQNITARHVALAAGLQDELAANVLRKAGRSLGLGMSNVVNVFEPQAIVLGGGIIKAGEPYLGPARDELARALAAQRRRPVRLDVTALGQDAGILGAAALAFDELLEDQG
ncbi:MAG: glucokinase [Actinomycetota bacterium]|jgi:glucokinase|nr:glucokinase [Actinomycetota bacterium]